MTTDSDMNKNRKIVCLMMLLSGTLVNTLTYLKVTNIHIIDTECTFVFDEALKYSRPKYCQKFLIFRACPECPDLSPAKTLLNFF